MPSISTFCKAISAAALIAGVLSSIGCNVEKLKSQNRMLAERNQKLADENRSLESRCNQLGSELQTKNRLLDQSRSEIAALEGKNDKLGETISELRDKVKDIASKRRPIVIKKNALPDTLNRELKAFAGKHPGIAEFDEENGMVKLKSDLTFPPGGAAVTGEAAKTLNQLVDILNGPGASAFSLYVAGHTDDMRIAKPQTKRRHPTNWYLSVHRAVGVQNQLVDAGMDPARICVMGFSKYHPVAPNKPGNGGNKLNRRVELWIVPSGAFLTGEAATISEEATDEEPIGS